MEKLRKILHEYRNYILCCVCFVSILLLSLVKGARFQINETETFGFLSLADILFKGTLTLGDYSFSLNHTSIIYRIVIVLLICCFACYSIYTFIKIDEKKKKIILGFIFFFNLIGILMLFLQSRIVETVDDVRKIGDVKIKNQMLWSYSTFVALFGLLYSLIIFTEIFSQNKYSVQEITETAVLIALAVVLDRFGTIRYGVNGGSSLNFSAVPLIIIGIRYGYFKGFIASSVIFGVMSCLLDGYGFQTYPFDYFIGFAGYAIVGVFYNLGTKISKKTSKNQLFFQILFVLISYIPMTLVRYIGGMSSGYLLYETEFVENFLYQSTYIPVSAAISIGSVIILLPVIGMLNRMYPPYKEIKIVENEPKN